GRCGAGGPVAGGGAPAGAALAGRAVGGAGCTGGPGEGDGKGGPRVRVELPVGTPSASRPSVGGDDGGGSGGGVGGGGTAPGGSRDATVPARVLWSRGSTGRDVRELQARLRQIAWPFEGPTRTYDAPTQKTVPGIQGKRGLPRTGRTDTVTWQRLKGMTREPGRWDLYQMGGQPADAPDPRCRT